MLLIILLATAAFGLAAAAGFFSVVGLATTYAGSFIAVAALGSAIEFGKLVAVSFLYRFWDTLQTGFKAVLTVMIIIVMVITSLGVFGFLANANQTDMVGLKQTIATQQLLIDEETRLAARKLQIDQQIAQLKSDDVQGRIRLNRQFNSEIKEINTRLPQITKEKSALAISQVKQQADVGPLVYLAKSLGLEIDIATTWFTLLLVAVLDPLAVMLTLCTNIAIAARQTKPATLEPVAPALVVDQPVEVPAVVAPQPEDLSSSRVIEKVVVALIGNGREPPPDEIEAEPLLVPEIPTPLAVTEESEKIVEDHQMALNFTLEPEDSADSLMELVHVAQGPQPVTDTVGVEQNTFGQPNRAAWDNFAVLSNDMANNRGAAGQEEFKQHLAQLRAYVDELDTRTESISEDEIALRSRILAFINRHQST